MEQVFFKGQPYTGDAAFINGSNGYECTEDHGLLCALILPEGPFEHVRSCWDKSGKPNYLTTETGEKIENRAAAVSGYRIEFKDGFEVGRFRQRMNEAVKEKAVSKAQQRFFGMVDAYKKGEMPDASPAIRKAADGMTKKQVKDFAKTKHKGLPNHVDENTLVRLIRESIQEHLVDVMKRYTEGKATPKEANKAIMDLANSSNSINERKNRSFYDYADEYMKKNGKKLPDEILKNAAKKNDERFFNRKK